MAYHTHLELSPCCANKRAKSAIIRGVTVPRHEMGRKNEKNIILAVKNEKEANDSILNYYDCRKCRWGLV